VRTTAMRPKSESDIRERILLFLESGAKQATGGIEGRTHARLHELVEHYFEGSPNQHSYERIDWRIVQRLFSHIFAQGATEKAWAPIGEELYGEMRYLHEPKPVE